MAPVLQCPDCGSKHPIDAASGASAFSCSGCGRQLKVPPQFLPAPAAVPPNGQGSTPASAPGVATTATAVAPDAISASPRQAARRDRAMQGAVPWWARLLLWLVALPLGFLLVFDWAHIFGVLSRTDLEDIYLGEGW